jgi:hypothetical protein
MANPLLKPHFSPRRIPGLGGRSKWRSTNTWMAKCLPWPGRGRPHHGSSTWPWPCASTSKAAPAAPYMADMKVQANAMEPFFTPMWWSPAASDAQDPLVKREPTSLSKCSRPARPPMTGAKFSRYRQLASLQEYVLVDTEPAPPMFSANADGLWVLHPFASDQAVDWPAWR